MQALDVLARCPLFVQLDDDALEALAAIATAGRFEAGEMLFFAGDEPAGLHVVVSGRVRVYVVAPDTGRELVLTVETPYRTVAELPSFDGGAYPANAQAMESTATVFLPQDRLEMLLRSHPGLAQHLLRTLGNRLRQLVGLVEKLSFLEVIHRLAAYLLDRTSRELPLQLEPNAVIAAQLGTVPELVSRNLSRLQHSGAIVMKERRIESIDRDELASLATRSSA